MEGWFCNYCNTIPMRSPFRHSCNLLCVIYPCSVFSFRSYAPVLPTDAKYSIVET
jgi:hypothetical protein